VSYQGRRTVLVTGAASGIGKATTVEFAALGANVSAVDLDTPHGTIDECADLPGHCLGITADVSVGEQIRGAVEETVDRFGRLDGVVCNAATGYPEPFLEMSEESWDRVGSPITVGLKDANLILAAADLARVPLPALNVYRDRLLGAVAHGDGDKDQAALAREQARACGLD
jgi:short-subunit dehydrogenase involved in D-alanine esterification of teichoic acids